MATKQPQPSSSARAQESSTNYVDSPILLSYKIPFPVRLRSVIFSVAHFFRIMSETQPILTPEFALIGSGHRSVDTYRQSLLYLYTRPKMRDLVFDHWMMTELRTYKDKKTNVKHEYLIATFTDGGEGKVHLRMERRIQDSAVKNFFQRGSKKPGLPSDSDEGEQVGGGGRPDDHRRTTFKKWANDDVSLYPDGQLIQDEDKNEQLPVEHMAFPEGDRINLPQMVLLACAIRQYSTTYHLTQNNCYWFCYTAAEALKTRFPESHSLPVKGKSQQGTWLGLPAGMLSKDVNIAELLTRFDTMYNTFKSEIDETINNPNNKHTKAARKLAEKEQKRAEKEQKRAEEAERRVEEEKKRAEEEKKRAEEEKKRAEQEKKEKKELESRIAELEAKLAAQAKAST